MKTALLIFILCPLFMNAQIITTVAGTGDRGYSGDGAAATNAQINSPYGVAADAAGNIYIADFGNNLIRKVMLSSGNIYTIGGNGGVCGSVPSTNGVPATTQPIRRPANIAVDDTGNVYTTTSCYIRKICADSDLINDIVPYEGSFFALDVNNNLYYNSNYEIVKWNLVTDTFSAIAGNGTSGYSGDEGPATNAEIYSASGIATDDSGNVYFSDMGNERIRKITYATGIINTIAGNGSSGYSGDGYPAIDAELNTPMGLAVDGSGNVFIADYYNNAVREIFAATGTIITIAGTGVAGYGPDGEEGTFSQLNNPTGVAVDDSDNIYIADFGNSRIRKISGSVASHISASAVNSVENQLSPVKIYPNPAKSVITVESGNSINQIIINNIIGQQVFSHEYKTDRANVNIADLPTGIYFIKVNGIQVRKLVKE